jgi:hypothetical protein
MRKGILVALLLTLLQGCSVTRTAYNNADVFLRWQANHYLDFEDEQSDELDRQLAAFLAWHREKALPQYARLGQEAAGRMQRGLKRADLEWSYDAVRAQIREALGQAAGEAAGLLDRLTPTQISHLERRLAEDNRKFAKERMQGTVEQRRQRRAKRNIERIEEWFGSLSEAQVERVQRYSERSPLAAELQDQDRRRRQAEFIAMLRAREARQKLAAWAQDWEGGRDPAYAKAVAATRAEYIDLLLDLDRTLSAEQREHAVVRLRRFAGLFNSLAMQP